MKTANQSLSTIISNVSVDSIPLAKNVNLDILKAGDNDALELVVEIPASKSKRGWNYTDKAIKDIVNHVNDNTLNGFLGHQKVENVDTEFPDIQTHWIGAKYDEAKKTGYFRGLIDKDATKLKRWIRSKRIKQVSIYGQPDIDKDKDGNINVVGYKAMSIDWTPLDRCGMDTSIKSIASGEMFYDSLIVGEQLNVNVEDKILLDIAKKYTNFTVLENSTDKKEITIAYKDNSNKFQTKTLKYDNINSNNNDTNTNLNKGGNDKVEKDQILKELRTNYLEGNIKDNEIIEVLKLTQKTIISQDIAKEVGEMTAIQLKTAIEVSKNKSIEDAKSKKNETIKEVVKEVITGEQQQKFILDTFITENTDKTKIKAEMEEFIKKETIKNVINNMTNTTPNNSSVGSNVNTNNTNNFGTGYLEDNKFLVPRT